MFETVGVMAVSACILQMVYEKIEKQVDDEFFYIKRYLLNKKAIATGISI